MAGRKGGLGKGLGALLPNAAADAKVKHSAVVQDIDVSEIVPNRAQPRTYFDEEALKELASSVKEVGVLQPILVRKMPFPVNAIDYAPRGPFAKDGMLMQVADELAAWVKGNTKAQSLKVDPAVTELDWSAGW